MNNNASNFMSIKERKNVILFRIVFFGLILFYLGIYIFPDGGDISRVYYILVLLPMLFLIFSLEKDSFKEKYLWLLLLLPIYLFASFFWLQEDFIQKNFPHKEEYLIRTPLFHFKKLFYIFFFLLAVLFVCKKDRQFSRRLLQFLFVVGFFSASISLLCFFFKECGIHSGRLSGFSVQDINKAGVIYTLHMCLCLFFIIYGFHEKRKNSIWLNVTLILGCLTSCAAVYFAKTDATWTMFFLMLFIALNPRWDKKASIMIFLCCVILICLAYFFGTYDRIASDYSFTIRVDLVKSSLTPWLEHKLFGLGMSHKLPVIISNGNVHLHPHNIFVDVLRYGGIIGLSVLVFTLCYLTYASFPNLNNNHIFRFIFAWFVAGIAIMTVYAQQPMTRPGGYVWALYWMPMALLVAELSIFDAKKINK